MSDDNKTRILPGPADEAAATRVLRASDLALAAAQAHDEGATRILKREELQAVSGEVARAAAAPAAPDDRIVFSCPNGHRIVIAKQFEGRRGKCNKCGAPVQIPKAPALPSADPFAALITAAESETEEVGADKESTPGDDGEPSPAPEGMPFVGLAASSSNDDEAEAEDQDDGETVDWSFAAAADAGGGEESSPWAAEPDVGQVFDVNSGNPTAQLVARLWMEREHGGVIEMHLVGGGVLLPEWYDANWSRGTHGLFASQAPDGTVTITAVAWEKVEKVIVRQLAAVPDDMFA